MNSATCEHGWKVTDNPACPWCYHERKKQQQRKNRRARRPSQRPHFVIDEKVLAEYIAAVYDWLPAASAHTAAIADWKAGDVARWLESRRADLPVQESLL